MASSNIRYGPGVSKEIGMVTAAHLHDRHQPQQKPRASHHQSLNVLWMFTSQIPLSEPCFLLQLVHVSKQIWDFVPVFPGPPEPRRSERLSDDRQELVASPSCEGCSRVPGQERSQLQGVRQRACGTHRLQVSWLTWLLDRNSCWREKRPKCTELIGDTWIN